MKFIYFLAYLTIIIGFYSCESSNKPITNPLNYNQEQPYFNIEPYIPYYQLDNRIDVGYIYNDDTKEDSTYIRATFYDNREFRNIGDLFLNKIQIYSFEAEKLFDIVQLIDGFIEFGIVYFKEDFILEHGREYTISNENPIEFPKFESKIQTIKEKLNISNVNDLKFISKSEGFEIISNLEQYTDTRIRIYNDEKSYIFFTNSTNSISLSPINMSTIVPNQYKIEVLKGFYKIDTLTNQEPLITNHYSAFIFNSSITE